MTTFSQKVITMLIASPLLSLSAYAADSEVKISPVVSTGSTANYKEEEGNLWFILDDSGSMGAKVRGLEDTIRVSPMYNYYSPTDVDRNYYDNCTKVADNYNFDQSYDAYQCTHHYYSYSSGSWKSNEGAYIASPDSFGNPVDENGRVNFPSQCSTYSGGFYIQNGNTMFTNNRVRYFCYAKKTSVEILRIQLGFIDYEQYATGTRYPAPKRLNGEEMPTPPVGQFYTDAFVDEASNPDTATPNYTTFDEVDNSGKASLEKGGFPGTNDPVTDVAACSVLEPDNSQEAQANCRRWKSYYRSRIDVLKSALSLSLFSEENEKIVSKLRLGYDSLNRNIASGTGAVNNRLPVRPFYGDDADANKKAMKKWLYALFANQGTPMRGRAAELVSDIINNIQNDASVNNPLLVNPGKAINSDNSIKACRRNYMLLMTDGGWNTTTDEEVENALSDDMVSPNDSTTLPDGTSYTPISPYISTRTANGYNYDPFNSQTLADIAFTAWATDIDGDDTNNDFKMTPILKEGDVRKTYKQADGYWHPHNDPANWQHINTYTLGFGLEDGDYHLNKKDTNGVVQIDEDTYFDRDFTWPIRTFHYTNDQTEIDKSPPDLANAALAGRGRYFDTKTADELKEAFNTMFAEFPEIPDQQGVKGSGGTAGTSQTLGNTYYSTSYNLDTGTNPPKTVGGELTKRFLFSGFEEDLTTCFGNAAPNNPRYGMLCTEKAWEASKILSATSHTTRNILSIKRQNDDEDLTSADTPATLAGADVVVDYSQINFTQAELSPLQHKRIVDNLPSIVKATDADEDVQVTNLIDYIAGDNTYEIGNGPAGTFRSRDNFPYTDSDGNATAGRNILGVIMRSSPVYSGIPTVTNLHPRLQEDDYINFISRYIWEDGEDSCLASTNCVAEDLVNIAFVGANDGMLHAFKTTTGEEVFSYVPNAVYEKLPTLVETGLNSFVDGNMSIDAINVAENGSSVQDTWKRVLTGTMGGGGKGVYALDITDPSNLSETVKWEYSELESQIYNSTADSVGKSNIGNIMASPSLIQLADGTWAVVVGNGYNSESGNAALIVINADTGEVIQEIVVKDEEDDSTGPNGLGPAYFVTYPGKTAATAAYADRAYAGDLHGNLWAFDLTNSSVDGGITVASETAASSTQEPLFTAMSSDGVRQPITVRPFVVEHPKKYGYLIHFGTGALFDETDISSEVNNSIYAIWDDWIPSNRGGLSSPRNTTVERDHLREVMFTTLEGDDITTADGTTATARELTPSAPLSWAYSGSDFSSKKRGWFIDLLPGERAWQPAMQTFGSNNVIGVGYNTVRYNQEDGTAANSCETAGSEVQSWRLTFNASDATQYLPSFGTLDINGDGINDNNDLNSDENGNNEDSGNANGNSPVSGISETGIVFNSASASLGAAPEATLDRTTVTNTDSPFCNYVTIFQPKSEKATPDSFVLCRSSDNASWRQLIKE